MADQAPEALTNVVEALRVKLNGHMVQLTNLRDAMITAESEEEVTMKFLVKRTESYNELLPLARNIVNTRSTIIMSQTYKSALFKLQQILKVVSVKTISDQQQQHMRAYVSCGEEDKDTQGKLLLDTFQLNYTREPVFEDNDLAKDFERKQIESIIAEFRMKVGLPQLLCIT